MATATKAVSERPILFSGPMVRAILEGRKTQTRRVVKGLPDGIKCASAIPESDYQYGFTDFNGTTVDLRCPYGRPALPLEPPRDRLWVRESLLEVSGEWVYSADKLPIELDADNPHVPAMISWAHHNDRDTCSPIHMPRWASRLILGITDVRVERLQELSEADAIAEGIEWDGRGETLHPVARFLEGWNSINAKRGYSWESNPWVWVIVFKAVANALRLASVLRA